MPESKAIFLDEILKRIGEFLISHVEEVHGGKTDPACYYKQFMKSPSFYINQELSTLPLLAYQKNQSNPAQVRNKVFVSYSHFDKEYLSSIQRHFKPFFDHIDFWDDTKIKPCPRLIGSAGYIPGTIDAERTGRIIATHPRPLIGLSKHSRKAAGEQQEKEYWFHMQGYLVTYNHFPH